MKKYLYAIIALVFFIMTERSYSLTIVRIFLGGTPPTNSIGGGNFTNIINVACDKWEKLIPDNFVLTLYFGWGDTTSGNHFLLSQGGNPNRELSGAIIFNNDNVPGHPLYWLDPTPLDNSEYTNYIAGSANLGGGNINVCRWYQKSTTNSHQDLLTVALHEIGHALGMALNNQSFINESSDGDIDITTGPFVGTIIPLQSNNNGVTSHISYIPPYCRTLMSGSFGGGDRVIPSDLDIIAVSQLSGFNMSPVLNMSKPYVVTTGTAKKKVSIKKSTLTWTQMFGGTYSVEQSSDLKAWSATGALVVSNNSIYSAEVTLTNNSSFYRLKQN